MTKTKIAELVQTIYNWRVRAGQQHSIYKFVNREFMEAFFASGSIRLGTLHGFRDTEAHGNYRGDVTEGINRVVQRIAHATETVPGSFLHSMIRIGTGSVIKDCLFVQERTWPDTYVFCTSATFNEDLFRQWNVSEGVDACYEIFDWQGFELEVSKRIASQALPMHSEYVTYVDGDIDGESQVRHIRAPFIKLRDFEWQREYRGAWLHKHPSVDVQAICIDIPDARRFCRKVATLEDGKVCYC
jgi:hypothetical protein